MVDRGLNRGNDEYRPTGEVGQNDPDDEGG